MSRLKEVIYSCGCCGTIHYPRRISKNEAKEEIESELFYTPAEQLLYLNMRYDDDAIEQEYYAVQEYITDLEKEKYKCGVCGKFDDPECRYEC